MKNIVRKMIMLMLSVLCALSFKTNIFAEEEETEPDVIQATFYLPVIQMDATWNFPYSDSWFTEDARNYSHDLCKASIGLAMASFRPSSKYSFDPENPDQNVRIFLAAAGFSNMRSDDYVKDPSKYTVSTVMGHKTIGTGDDSFELIAVGVCGEGYMDEWESNFTIGDEKEHTGFSYSASLIYDRIFGYIASQKISGRIKIWITGFSRAAACANITAARLSDSDVFSQEDVFAYTFATPRTVRYARSTKYKNIFNIVNKADPIPQTPFADWGYERYGKTLYLPCIQTDSDYINRSARMEEIYREVTGQEIWYNIDMETDIRSLMDYLLRLIPDSKTYKAQIQDQMISLWENHDLLSVMNKLIALSNEPLMFDKENRSLANGVLDYIANKVVDYFTAETSFRRWNSQTGAGMNLVYQHGPERYLAWIFSADSYEDLYTDSKQYSRLIIQGDVNVIAEGAVEEDGSSYVISSDRAETERYDYIKVEKGRTVLQMPRDIEWDLTIESQKDQTISLYETTYSVIRISPRSSIVTSYALKEGEVLKIRFLPGGHQMVLTTPIIPEKQTLLSTDSADFITEMAGLERTNLFNLSWRHMVMIVISLPVILISLLLFWLCVVAAKYRFRTKKKLGIIDKNAKFRTLPILCVCLIFVAFIIEEFLSLLLPDAVQVRGFFRIIIGVLSATIAWCGYRKSPGKLHASVLLGILLLMMADLLTTGSLLYGVLAHTVASIYLAHAYYTFKKPDRKQIIIWALLVLASVGIMLVLRIASGFMNVVTGLYIASALAMVIMSISMPKRFFYASLLLVISTALIFVFTLTGMQFITHLLTFALYYTAVSMLSSATMMQKPADPKWNLKPQNENSLPA